MESQIALLRAIKRGELPASAENLKRAFNRDVLTERSVANQTASTESTLNAIDHETERLGSTIKRRLEQIDQLKSVLADEARNEESKYTGSPDAKSNSLKQFEELRHIVLRLAEGHLGALGLGDSKDISQVLWRLVEVTSRNEQLLVPADLRIVQFLVNEGLVRSEPAGNNRLRIRIH